jgi:hypothetical protein
MDKVFLCPKAYILKGRFLSEKFPNCTPETIKATPFQRQPKIFLQQENAPAFRVSNVQFGNSML